jgi:peptide/nickel transport system substrate-binding protein
MRQVHSIKEVRTIPSLSQIRQLPRILSLQEKKLFFTGVFSLCLGIVLLFLGSLSLLFSTVPRQGGKLTEGILGYPQLINPLYANANTVDRELTALIYSGLLVYNPTTQSLAPDLAESYSLSEDEKTYTVILKQGATWQDGEPLSAYDVVFTYAALQNSAYGSPLFEAYRNIAVTQVDDRTVTFTLTEAYAAFPELLTVGILPAHLWEEISPVNAQLNALNLKPVGTGPYILEKTSKDSRGIIRSISLQANENYIGKHPYLDEIVMKFYSSTADLVQALQTKRIDATAALSSSETLSLREDSSLNTTPFPLLQYVGAFFNTKKAPISEVNMRKALALALNIPQITAEATGNLGVPSGFTLPGFPATAASVQDTQVAGSLLDGLGWNLNEAGKRSKDGTELTLTITTAERPELVRAAKSIAAAWEGMGISVTVNSLANTDITAALQEKTYDVLVAAEQYGAIADPYPFWHSSGKGANGLNVSQFSTAATDAAVSTLRASASPEKRAEAFVTLNQELIDNMPAVFLFQNIVPLAHTVDILGITSQNIPNAQSRWILTPSWYRRTGLAWKF